MTTAVYTFYAVAFVPWVVLALTYQSNPWSWLIMGRPTAFQRWPDADPLVVMAQMLDLLLPPA